MQGKLLQVEAHAISEMEAVNHRSSCLPCFFWKERNIYVFPATSVSSVFQVLLGFDRLANVQANWLGNHYKKRTGIIVLRDNEDGARFLGRIAEISSPLDVGKKIETRSEFYLWEDLGSIIEDIIKNLVSIRRLLICVAVAGVAECFVELQVVRLPRDGEGDHCPPVLAPHDAPLSQLFSTRVTLSNEATLFLPPQGINPTSSTQNLLPSPMPSSCSYQQLPPSDQPGSYTSNLRALDDDAQRFPLTNEDRQTKEFGTEEQHAEGRFTWSSIELRFEPDLKAVTKDW